MLGIDGAICLCLDKRKEFWPEMLDGLHNVGKKPKLFIAGDGTDESLVYDYIDNPNPPLIGWGYGREGYKHHHYNALACHKEMIKYAKSNGWKNTLFLEDDIYVLDRYKSVLDNAPTDIDYDLLYLGWWKGDENDSWNRYIEDEYSRTRICGWDRVDRVSGFHAVVVNERLYDLILSLPMNNPLDCQLIPYYHILRTYIIIPKVIHIRNIHSFCEGTTITRRVL